jgi:hypothetical protein
MDEMYDLKYSLTRLNQPRTHYYKRLYRRRILSTRAVECDPNAPCEVYALTCERDYLDLIWCLKTFSHYSRLVFHLVIHDDGSLTEGALDRLAGHFRYARIIRGADADEEMRGGSRRLRQAEG